VGFFVEQERLAFGVWGFGVWGSAFGARRIGVSAYRRSAFGVRRIGVSAYRRIGVWRIGVSAFGVWCLALGVRRIGVVGVWARKRREALLDLSL
jgi:hypothetical protein